MRRRVAGAAILVAMGIGIWLSSLFKGLGPGGDGSRGAFAPQPRAEVGNADLSPRDTPESVSAPGVRTGAAIPTVVIDERQYFLENHGGDVTRLIPTDVSAETQLIPTDVAHIVALVQQTEPNDDGIRVQIKRRRSSRPSAETALDKALHEAGVTDEQILRHSGFVD